MPAIPIRARLAGVAVGAIIVVHLMLVNLSPSSSYAQKTSIRQWTSGSSSGNDQKAVQDIYDSLKDSAPAKNTTRANAAFVILARNSDLWGIMASIRQMEDRFNRKYK
jgi:alpha 1,2-mannosyltransferase